MDKKPRNALERLKILYESLQYETDRAACKAIGVSRSSLYRWRARSNGMSGTDIFNSLTNRPPVHRTHAQQLPPHVEAMIRDIRAENGWGSTRIKPVIDHHGYEVSRQAIDRVLRQARQGAEQTTSTSNGGVDIPDDPLPTVSDSAPESIVFDAKKFEDTLNMMFDVASPRLLRLFREHQQSQKKILEEFHRIEKKVTVRRPK